ncbi:MAG: 8-amino-7-oxononanoate synthase [Neisseriaceae bacterium]|nr:8-amino-7-oxononanoate synthase [Neisseriaceae bacterium]
MSWSIKINQGLAHKEQQHTYRRRTTRSALCHGASILVKQQRYLNFASNDYLGFSQDSGLIQQGQNHLAHYGLGSGGSPLLVGHTEVHAQLEADLAHWQGYDRALLFISGFAANQALIYALLAAGDRVLADRLSHASLLEAALHSPAELRRFQHNQPASLATLLAKPCAGASLVFTEGVFSMDGDQAPLAALSALSQQHEALLVVDDAHGVGVLGPEGRGSCAAQGVKPDVLILTFGKALGLSGAAILCAEPIAEYLLQYARHYIYSTAMPAFQAAMLHDALRKVQADAQPQQRLQHNIRYFHERWAQAAIPLPLLPSQTAIQPVLMGSSEATLWAAERLRAQGLWLGAIRPPTVPPQQGRLRLTLTALHSEADIDVLIEGMRDVAKTKP